MDNHFKKEEKLKHKKLITLLFKEGKSISKYPIQLVYFKFQHNGNRALKAGFTVSKRNFKRAVDRNLIKRHLREAYRLKKQTIYPLLNDKYIVMFIYLDNEILPRKTIHTKMEQLLQIFVKTIK